MFILGEIFSFLSSACLALSSLQKNKRNMMIWHSANTCFYCLSNLCLGGYSAVVTSALTLTRNTLQIKGRLNRTITALICLLMILIGCLFNNRGLIGLLPITASVIYTLCVYLVHSPQGMRLALLANLAQYAVFDFTLRAYPAFISGIVIIVITLGKYIREKYFETADEKD